MTESLLLTSVVLFHMPTAFSTVVSAYVQSGKLFTWDCWGKIADVMVLVRTILHDLLFQ